MCQCLCVSVCLSFFLPLFICLSFLHLTLFYTFLKYAHVFVNCCTGVSVSVCLSFLLSICLSPSVCLCLYDCLSFFLSVFLSCYLSVCLFVTRPYSTHVLSKLMYRRVSAFCLSVCLFVFLSFYLYVTFCLSLWHPTLFYTFYVLLLFRFWHKGNLSLDQKRYVSPTKMYR